MAKQMKSGWFTTPGRPGDRTLQDQVKGLDHVFEFVRGKTVLDIGAAEGMLTAEMQRRGAVAVHGVEVVKAHVETGRKVHADLAACFEVGDANVWVPKRKYHVVLLLAVLHKLSNPTEACARFADAATDMVVIRLPPEHAPTIIDSRSGNNPNHIDRVMSARGWRLERLTRGHCEEWCGTYVRSEA
jgi:hypothetical protein